VETASLVEKSAPGPTDRLQDGPIVVQHAMRKLPLVYIKPDPFDRRSIVVSCICKVRSSCQPGCASASTVGTLGGSWLKECSKKCVSCISIRARVRMAVSLGTNYNTLLRMGIEMPDGTRALRRASEAAGILGSERQRREADGLVRDDHVTRQRHFLHQT
jgi:hypothetical protein